MIYFWISNLPSNLEVISLKPQNLGQLPGPDFLQQRTPEPLMHQITVTRCEDV